MFWIIAGGCVCGLAMGAYFSKSVIQREYKIMKLKSQGFELLTTPYHKRSHQMIRYKGYNFYSYLTPNLLKARDFEIRKDDVFVLSFPKSGTTWLQEIVYLIQTNMDFEGAMNQNIDQRFPLLEYVFPGVDAISKMPSPRLIKSHLPFSLLPDDIHEKKPKILYIARNPKDVVVSFYHFAFKFLKTFEREVFTGTFDDYCQLFVDDLGLYGPWWKHVKEAWDKRDDENVLFVTYEDLHSDIGGSIKKVAAFLGKPIRDDDVEVIANHCSFNTMKNNDTVNYTWFRKINMAENDTSLMRKGKVGDWKNHLSPKIVAQIDDMVKTKLEPSGLKFKDSMED